MSLRDFVCNILEYCNSLNYNLSEEVKKARDEIDQYYDKEMAPKDLCDSNEDSKI